MTNAIEVRTATAGWQADLAPDPETFGQRAVQAALDTAAASMTECEVSVLLTDDAEMTELNARWRGVDRPTNVLAFPMADEAERRVAGDIAVAHATVTREAQAQGKSVNAHTAHMIIHGVLHLLGYRHDDDTEARDMAAAEVRALAKLGMDDPYSTSTAMKGVQT